MLQQLLGYPPISFPRDVKKWSRICEKAASVLSENTTCSASEAAERIRDIAGGRILVIGLSDVDLAKDHLVNYVGSSRPDVHLWEFEDYIHTPRIGGFRALSVGASLDQMQGFPFELQIMTPLQHTWDKLQHPVYEKARSKGIVVPPDVEQWFEELSSKLYALDQEISTKQEDYRTRGVL